MDKDPLEEVRLLEAAIRKRLQEKGMDLAAPIAISPQGDDGAHMEVAVGLTADALRTSEEREAAAIDKQFAAMMGAEEFEVTDPDEEEKEAEGEKKLDSLMNDLKNWDLDD